MTETKLSSPASPGSCKGTGIAGSVNFLNHSLKDPEKLLTPVCTRTESKACLHVSTSVLSYVRVSMPPGN